MLVEVIRDSREIVCPQHLLIWRMKREEDMIVQHLHPELQELLTTAQSQDRTLTYDQVNDFLPDEDISPAKLNDLLLAQAIRLPKGLRPGLYHSYNP